MASTLARFESSGCLPVEASTNSYAAAPVDKKDTFQHRIVDAWQASRNYPGIFEPMWRPILRRVEVCIQSHGGHISTYKRTLSAIAHKLNVSRHILVWTFFLILVCGTRAQSLSAPFTYTLFIYIEAAAHVLKYHAMNKWKDKDMAPSYWASNPGPSASNQSL
jgi:hypothetical protein